MLYFVPAAMYCLYNNLQFVNLATYDPTTYFLLLQMRVVVTGVVFQVMSVSNIWLWDSSGIFQFAESANNDNDSCSVLRAIVQMAFIFYQIKQYKNVYDQCFW